MGWGDLRGFTDYLVRNDLVPERYAKFHGMWVERCLPLRRIRRRRRPRACPTAVSRASVSVTMKDMKVMKVGPPGRHRCPPLLAVLRSSVGHRQVAPEQ